MLEEDHKYACACVKPKAYYKPAKEDPKYLWALASFQAGSMVDFVNISCRPDCKLWLLGYLPIRRGDSVVLSRRM